MTSRSTEDYDRGDKQSHYKQLEDVRAVLIVSHRRREVTVVERTAHGWAERTVRSGERIVVDDLALSPPVDELYDGIELEPA